MKHRLSNLDILRGLAALLVCAGHLRAFLMVDLWQIKSPTMMDRMFYLTTGLGHQAVMVFFVLSGYLVGGGVLTAYQSGHWSRLHYILRRMSRLWMVLLPALVLTLAFDSLGRHWFPSGYDGGFQGLYNSGPTLSAPTDLRATTFLGNALFLQTISVPRLGTNGPLWSLANEFWYYVLFPLICGIWFLRAWTVRLLYALLAGTLLWWLPAAFVWGGVIWVFGVAAFWAGRHELIGKLCRHPVCLIFTGLLFFGSLAASKTRSVWGADWCVGAAFALWVAGLASCEPPFVWEKKNRHRIVRHLLHPLFSSLSPAGICLFWLF